MPLLRRRQNQCPDPVEQMQDLAAGARCSDVLCFCGAELKLLAEQAVPFIEQVTSHRAGGQQAKARTLAFCGYQGTVAYSMIGMVCMMFCVGFQMHRA